MTSFFNDTFTTGSTTPITAHTPDSGGTWVAGYGASQPSVYPSSGGAAAGGTASSSTLASVSAPSADISLDFAWHIDTTGIANIGVLVRANSDGSNAYVPVYVPATGKFQMFKFTEAAGASAVSLGTSAGTYNYANNSDVVGNVSAVGNVITVTAGGVQVLQVTDSSYPTNKRFGLWFGQPNNSAAAQGVFVNSFSATDLASGGSGGGTTPTAPGAPTISTASAGNGYVDVAFTAPASNGGSAISNYTATLSTGENNSGTTSPIRVTASNGTSRTGHVTATNSVGTGSASAESNSVTPSAVTTITGVSINPSSASVAGGGTQSFTGSVSGTGSPPQAVTWSGSGAAYLNSTTANPATFTAPTTTSAQTLSLTATASDGSHTATATITVSAAAAVAPPATITQYADRVKETGASISGSVIALTGVAAAAGLRSFASAFPVGTKGIPILFGDTADAGAFIVASATRTSSAALTIDKIYSSSTGGGMPVFGTGAKDVECVLPASQIVRKDFIDLADYAVDPTFTTDSTAGIQAAINDAYNSGIGLIRVPVGRYKIAGPLVTNVGGYNPNSQLYIPQTRQANPNKTIIFEGVCPPNFENQILHDVPPTTNGVVFESTIVGTGAEPAVISMVPGNTGDEWPWNYTNIGFRNMGVRASVTGGANSMSALNLRNAAQIAGIDRVRLDINMGLLSSPNPSGTNSAGLIMPGVNNHGLMNCGTVYVAGYNHGVVMNEHSHFDNLIAIGCYNAIRLDQCYHASYIGQLSVEGCVNSIVINGDHALAIGMYDCEHLAINGSWYVYEKDIKYNSGGRKVTMLQSAVVISNIGISDASFTTNATSANYKIISGAGAN